LENSDDERGCPLTFTSPHWGEGQGEGKTPRLLTQTPLCERGMNTPSFQDTPLEEGNKG